MSVKPKGLQCPKSKQFQGSSLEYDEKSTQFANYSRLGLLADANQIGAVKQTTTVRNRITGFKPRVKVPTTTVVPEVSSTEAHPLEMEMGEALKTVRKVPPGERTVLLKLRARHGDDFAAMARDMRLNAYQHTAAHLRHRIEKMQEDDAQDAADAAAALEAGQAVPLPRDRRKITKDPNNAFKRRSRNFT